MGIHGEVALHNWDRQLVTEGPWHEHGLGPRLSAFPNNSWVRGVDFRVEKVGVFEEEHSLTGTYQRPRYSSRGSWG